MTPKNEPQAPEWECRNAGATSPKSELGRKTRYHQCPGAIDDDRELKWGPFQLLALISTEAGTNWDSGNGRPAKAEGCGWSPPVKQNNKKWAAKLGYRKSSTIGGYIIDLVRRGWIIRTDAGLRLVRKKRDQPYWNIQFELWDIGLMHKSRAREFRVFMRIARRRKCWEATPNIAAGTNIDVKAIPGLLRWLSGQKVQDSDKKWEGVIERVPSDRRTNEYRIKPLHPRVREPSWISDCDDAISDASESMLKKWKEREVSPPDESVSSIFNAIKHSIKAEVALVRQVFDGISDELIVDIVLIEMERAVDAHLSKRSSRRRWCKYLNRFLRGGHWTDNLWDQDQRSKQEELNSLPPSKRKITATIVGLTETYEMPDLPHSPMGEL